MQQEIVISERSDQLDEKTGQKNSREGGGSGGMAL